MQRVYAPYTLLILKLDISTSNILFPTEDVAAFTHFVDCELANPSPRKVLDDGREIYLARQIRMVKDAGIHYPVLSDFSSAVDGTLGLYHHRAYPKFYRPPEEMLGIGWSYPADIWNVGVLVRTSRAQPPNV